MGYRSEWNGFRCCTSRSVGSEPCFLLTKSFALAHPTDLTFPVSMKAFWLLSATSLALRNPACRCFYGDWCWPKESNFSALASQVSQPPLHPESPESAWYPDFHASGNWSQINGVRMQASNFELTAITLGAVVRSLQRQGATETAGAAGGWIIGSGHSALAPRQGLGTFE
jgi:hypothetical protein